MAEKIELISKTKRQNLCNFASARFLVYKLLLLSYGSSCMKARNIVCGVSQIFQLRKKN